MTRNTKRNPITKAGAVELEDTQLDAISGGPDTYIKFDGVDGESERADVPVEDFSLNFEEIKFRR